MDSDHPHIIYYDGDGGVWGNGKAFIKDEGKGFSSGDIVTIRACVKTGMIQWIVNGKLSASYSSNKLKKQEIRWVFYMKMYNNRD